MLVVTRNVGQKIVIGPPDKPIATITVQRANGHKVRLAIEADRSLEVNRIEVANRKAARVD